ncbi:MAG: radical SAM protein [Thermoguttaceae bacterium]|nr:radical SAM protein [Thermoguttaceae bacterium]
MSFPGVMRYLLFGAGYWVRRRIFSRRTPFIAGLVLNQSCNLACDGCRVRQAGRDADASRADVEKALADFRRSGVRNLAITGGEPFFWESDGWRVRDVIHEARRLGFLAVTVYTNGTLPFDDCGADAVFVSPHGMEGTSGNGEAWQKCRENLDSTTHPNVILNFTINSRNASTLREVCEFVRGHDRIRGVFFYFHTPYYGRDELFQPMEEKRQIVREILALKREGFPIFNSAAALKSFDRDDWKRPSDLCVVWERGRIFRCCRSNSNEDSCRNCGYLGYLELEQILALKPSAIFEGTRYVGRNS